jgi:hypothetical protein
MGLSTNDVLMGDAMGRTRLYLGEVGAAVTAQVAHRSEASLCVRRALPFLRLESEVMDEDGRAARIASVRVDVEGDVPMLHMELVYPARPARRDATLPYGFATCAPVAPIVHRTEDRADDTLVFATDVPGDPAPPALALRPRTLVERLARAVRGLLARFLRRLEPSLP